MGILQLAGAVKGAGDRMGKSLDTLQTGMMQEHLMAEREKYEQARLKATFQQQTGILGMQQKFEGDQTERKLQSAEGIESRRQAGEDTRLRETLTSQEGRQNKQLASEEKLTLAQIAARRDEGDEDRASREKMAGQDVRSRERIAEKNIAALATEKAKDRKYDAGKTQTEIARDLLVAKWRQLDGAGRKAQLDPELDAWIDIQKKKMEGLHERLKSLDPNDVAAAQRDIDKLSGIIDQRLHMAPVASEGKPASRVDIGQFDPFKGKGPIK